MPTRTIAPGSSGREARLTATRDGLLYEARAKSVGQIVLLSVMLLLMLPVLIGAGAVAVLGVRALLDGEMLAALACGVISIAGLIGGYVFHRLLALVLPFKARIDGRGYRLRNGLLWFRVAGDASQADILVYPSYSGGDWGYAGWIRFRGRHIKWPFMQPLIEGSKHKAVRTAESMCCWLRENAPIADARLTKHWGNPAGVRPGKEYVR